MRLVNASKFRLATVVFAALAALAVIGAAPSSHAAGIGQVKKVSGDAYIIRGESKVRASVGDALEQRDVIETGDNGAIGISFKDNTVLSAGPGTTLSLDQFSFNSATLEGAIKTNMSSGTLSVISGDIVKRTPGAMKIKTPTAILGVRGTEFVVKVD